MIKKKFGFYTVLVYIVVLFSTSFVQAADVSDTIKLKFVGAWSGESRVKDTLRTWIQERFADGTYRTYYFLIKGSELQRYIDYGIWWIKDNKFYEITPKMMKKPDVYEYKILNESRIWFKSLNSNYEFYDILMIENRLEVILTE